MVRFLHSYQDLACRFPHTRGDGPKTHHSRETCEIVFPTRVGMVRKLCFWEVRKFCFPHTRGDGPKKREVKGSQVKNSIDNLLN